MLTGETMLQPMMQACPSFDWQNYWQGSDGSQLNIILGDLGSHILRLLDRNEPCRGVFNVIEQWFAEGDNFVRQTAEIGLIERIKHAKGPKSSSWKLFRAHLGPLSRAVWDRT